MKPVQEKQSPFYTADKSLMIEGYITYFEHFTRHKYRLLQEYGKSTTPNRNERLNVGKKVIPNNHLPSCGHVLIFKKQDDITIQLKLQIIIM